MSSPPTSTAAAQPAADGLEDPAGEEDSDQALVSTRPRLTPAREAPVSDWSPPSSMDEYRLVKKLGAGANGQVYLYQDTALNRPVAIKFLADLAQDDAVARQRFMIEAQAIARLSHPNVVAIHRAGELAGRSYLVSEYAAGATLDGMARPMAAAEVLRIAVELSRGLAAVHAKGVLHRDIKLANIFVDQDGHIKLGDFGLAKFVSEAASPAALAASPGPRPALAPGESKHEHWNRLTQSGAFLGTPLYMAPETWELAQPTPAMDVYSVGVVLYELCCGHTPFTATSVTALCAAVLNQEPTPLTPQEADAALAAIIHRCLRRDPRERFASAVELCAALEALASAEQPAGRARRPLVARVSPRWIGVTLGLCAGLGAVLVHRLHRSPPAMVEIPGGTFNMGSTEVEIKAAYSWSRNMGCASCPRELYEREQPLRRVQVSAFQIDTTEVTNEDFAAWLNQRAGLRLDRERYVMEGPVLVADIWESYAFGGVVRRESRYAVRPGYERKPVVQVSWNGALRYCQDHGKRLPTEAEWEFAARGAGSARFPWGDLEPGCKDFVYGRIHGQDCAAMGVGPAEVGQTPKDRSPEGVLDLGGNVAEWVMDTFRSRYLPCAQTSCRDPVVRDNTAQDGGKEVHVVKGGAWFREVAAMRSAGRSKSREDDISGDMGFRCARGVLL